MPQLIFLLTTVISFDRNFVGYVCNGESHNDVAFICSNVLRNLHKVLLELQVYFFGISWNIFNFRFQLYANVQNHFAISQLLNLIILTKETSVVINPT
jgi:hypothetical protein